MLNELQTHTRTHTKYTHIASGYESEVSSRYRNCIYLCPTMIHMMWRYRDGKEMICSTYLCLYIIYDLYTGKQNHIFTLKTVFKIEKIKENI